MRKATLDLGVVSSGTLRGEDLVPALLKAAYGIRLEKKERAKVSKILAFHRFLSGLNADSPIRNMYWGGAGPSEDVEALSGILNSHTPDYCYFGTSYGDGTEFGTWVDWDAIDRDVASGRIFKSHEPAVGGRSSGASYWLQVDVRWNATLWRRVGRSRWARIWDLVV